MKISEKIGGLIDETEQLVDAKVESIQLETVEKTVNVSASVLCGVLLFGVAFLGMALLSVIGVLILAQIMSYLWASVIVFSFLALIFIVLLIYKERLLIRPIKNYLFGEYIKTHRSEKNG